MPTRVLISGHRGYHAKEIENTLAAFRRAIKERVDFIEFDVVQTRDQVPVVFHDRRVDRLLNAKGPVASFTLAELQRLEYKDGQHVLTLEELFQETAGKIRPMLEIKASGVEEATVQLVRKYDLAQRIIVQSFSAKSLRRCLQLDPGLPYALNMRPIFNLGGFGEWTRLHRLTARASYARLLNHLPVTYIHPDGPFVHDSFIQLALQRGKRVIIGAIRTQNYVPKIKEWGIEILNCNDPSQVRDAIKKYWGNEVVCE